MSKNLKKTTKTKLSLTSFSLLALKETKSKVSNSRKVISVAEKSCIELFSDHDGKDDSSDKNTSMNYRTVTLFTYKWNKEDLKKEYW